MPGPSKEGPFITMASAKVLLAFPILESHLVIDLGKCTPGSKIPPHSYGPTVGLTSSEASGPPVIEVIHKVLGSE